MGKLKSFTKLTKVEESLPQKFSTLPNVSILVLVLEIAQIWEITG